MIVRFPPTWLESCRTVPIPILFARLGGPRHLILHGTRTQRPVAIPLGHRCPLHRFPQRELIILYSSQARALAPGQKKVDSKIMTTILYFNRLLILKIRQYYTPKKKFNVNNIYTAVGNKNLMTSKQTSYNSSFTNLSIISGKLLCTSVH